MLFHVKHTHSWEACLHHDADRAREALAEVVPRVTEGT